MLIQKGLSWRSEVIDQPVFPGQNLNVNLIVTNNSSKALEVPRLTTDKWMRVESPSREWNEAEQKTVFKWLYHRPNKVGEKLNCSLDTVIVFPGETRTFSPRRLPEVLLGAELSPDTTTLPRLDFAVSVQGDQQYAVHIGRFEIMGTYTVQDIEISDYTCMDAPARSWNRSERAGGKDTQSYCLMLAIAKSKDRTLLLTSSSTGPSDAYERALSSVAGEKGILVDRSLVLNTPLVLAELPHDSRFALSRTAKPVSVVQFAIISGGQRLESAWVESTFQSLKLNGK